MSDLFGRERLVEIFLVEDNPGDVCLTREALKSDRLRNRLSVVRDVVEAMSYLRRELNGAVRPDLILPDLNLPRKDGREVLAEIETDGDLKLIPVVLTTFTAPGDVLSACGLHANCCIAKPGDLGEFLTVVESIENSWSSTVRLPSK